ncbi:MAG TPA: glycosyltransferase family 2 protein [Rudaea sp.]|nr:glycosyltransferase family 2 protein [Rudaea sp.]
MSSGLTSIIIVAADSGGELGRCVESVLAVNGKIQVVVSDNASSDGSISALAARWSNDPRLHIVHNGANLGFGAGCNRGAAVAAGNGLVFLNPDCRVESDTIARLRSIADGDSRIGLIGARVLGMDGKPETASRRRDPLLRRALASMVGLARWQSRWKVLSGVDLPVDGSTVAIENVDAVSGAAMYVPRAVFDELGGFDEGYFLHCEDLDLCRRIRDAGFRVVCANDVVVQHAKGTSSRSRPLFVARHKHRGMWRWFTKFDPAARNPLLRALVWLGIWAHFFVLAPRYLWQAGKAMRQR